MGKEGEEKKGGRRRLYKKRMSDMIAFLMKHSTHTFLLFLSLFGKKILSVTDALPPPLFVL